MDKVLSHILGSLCSCSLTKEHIQHLEIILDELQEATIIRKPQEMCFIEAWDVIFGQHYFKRQESADQYSSP